MDELDVDAIENRALNATGGEWKADELNRVTNGIKIICTCDQFGGLADAEFIANAREDVLALLECVRENERLRREIETLEDDVSSAEDERDEAEEELKRKNKLIEELREMIVGVESDLKKLKEMR